MGDQVPNQILNTYRSGGYKYRVKEIKSVARLKRKVMNIQVFSENEQRFFWEFGHLLFLSFFSPELSPCRLSTVTAMRRIVFGIQVGLQ